MDLEWESPSTLYKLIDELGNNRLFSFIYTSYITTLNLNGNEKILDFGSGSGAGSRHLAKLLQNGHLTCVDISNYWTEKAKKRMKKYKNVDFFVGQLTELGFEENSFDAVYIFYALHDVTENLREGIIKEAYRILKPEGKLYIKEPQRLNDGMPISEIKELMSTGKFYEKSSKEEKGTFRGEYLKGKK